MINFKQVSNILEGWRNHLLPPTALKDLILETSVQRLKECHNCPFNSTQGSIKMTSTCKACGCPLVQKSKCLSCACGLEDWNEKNPDNKFGVRWFPVATDEQDEEIDKALTDDAT